MTGPAMNDSSLPMEAPKPRLRFPRSARVISARDFDHVMREGRRLGDASLSLRVVRNELDQTRLGLVVGKRYGGAVARNRAKRIIREAFRLVRPRLPSGWDIAVQPKAGADIRLPTVVESLLRAAAKLERRRAAQDEQ